MKKFIISFLLACLILSVYASAVGDRWLYPEMESIIENQMTQSDIELIQQKFDVSTETAREIANGNTVIKAYFCIFWNEADKPILQQLDNLENLENYYYKFFVFNNDVGFLNRKVVVDGKENIEIFTEETTPTFLLELRETKDSIFFNNQEYNIENIQIFDGRGNHQGTTVYFVCDKGTIVKHYEDAYSDAVVLSESEYSIYAKEYYAYLINTAYNENGEPTYGGISFSEFVENFQEYKQQNAESENSKINWVVVITVVTIILVIMALAFIIIKKMRV